MPTVVTKVVRYTGGDYTTLSAALAAVPSNLVTADQQWDILIAESAAGNYEWNLGSSGPRNIGQGVTADATRFIRIKPYPGLGFADRSYSGPTDYDPVKGIALKASNVVLGVLGNNVVIEGLQLKQTATTLNSGERALSTESGSAAGSTVKNCIISSNFAADNRGTVYWFASTMINCLVISNGGGGVSGAASILNTTIINIGSGTSRTGVDIPYDNPTVKNSAIFGFDTLFTPAKAFASGSNNNATNVASGSTPTNWGSNSLSGLVTAEQFATISTTTNTGNFRLRKSSPLVRGGTRDATNTGDLDIAGRSRSLTLPSIGVWEEPSASGTVFPANIRFPIRDANGNPTSTVVDMGDMFLRKEQYLTAGLWTWGSNNNNGFVNPGGMLALGDTSNRSSPSQVGTLATWRQVSCGYSNFAAIKTDGTLWVCGPNLHGELGQNDMTPRSSPVQVGSMTDWKTVCAASQWMLGLKNDGTLWTWGYNWAGQMGNGTSLDYSSPVQVGALTDWKQIAVGSYHALIIKNDGSLWSWGEDTYSVGLPSGRLGLNYPWFANSRYSSPVQVGSLTDWKQVAGSARASAAIKQDGTLWTWGSNNNNEMGNGNSIDYSSPVQIGSLTDWKFVSGGRFHMAAIKKDGTLWTWGSNNQGALGHGDTVNRSSPVKVGALNTWKQVTCGYSYTIALKTDGTLWSWGRNDYGQLGLGNTSSRSSPVQVGTLTSWKSTGYGGCGYYWTSAIQSPDLP